MHPSTPRQVTEAFSAVRRLYFVLIALEFACFAVVALGWALLLMPRIHVWWLLVPLLPIHLLFRRIAARKIVCPACRTPLIDDDGFAVFAKACDHCGTRFR